MTCSVLRAHCIAIGGAREPSLGGVREPLRKGVYCTSEGGGYMLVSFSDGYALRSDSLHAQLAPFTVLKGQPFKRDCTAVLLQEPSLHRG